MKKKHLELNALLVTTKSIDGYPALQLVFELDGVKHLVPANLPREVEAKVWWVAAGKPELPEWRL